MQCHRSPDPLMEDKDQAELGSSKKEHWNHDEDGNGDDGVCDVDGKDGGVRHDICQNVYTSKLWTDHILPINA